MTENNEDIILNLHTSILKAIQQNDMIAANEIIAHSKIENIQFLNYQVDFQAIHAAVWFGNMRLLLLFISEGADVNSISNNQMDCLTIAAFRDNISLVQILISLVSNPNYVSRKGTALHIAAMNDNVEIMRLLLKHPKIDINIKFQGETPLKLAGHKTKQLLELQERAILSASSISHSSIDSQIQLEKPSFSCGKVWKISRMGFCHKRRFITIDPLYGVMNIYKEKQQFPNYWLQVISLEQIKKIKIDNDHWYAKDNFQYLTIKLQNKNNIVISTLYNTTICVWQDLLNKAIKFYKNYKSLKKSKQNLVNFTMLEIQDKLLFNQQQHINKQKNKIKQIYQPDQIISSEKSEYESIKLSDLKVIKCIGKGSFGYVFKVIYQNNEYALKQQQKKMLKESKNLEYALQEVQLLYKLKHPFIVNFQVSFQTTNNLYILMDLLPRGDLAMYMTRGVKLDIQQSKILIAQIVLAIEYLHSSDIIYRDLKPENIGICDDGYIKIIDFGLAKGLQRDSFTYTVCGSPAYLAPEVVLNYGTTMQTDIYQIGLLLYEMLTGYPPFYTTKLDILIENIKLEQIKVPKDLPTDVRDLLNRMLKREQDKRISIQEIKQHIFFKDLNWQKLYDKKYQVPELRQCFPQSRKATGELIDTDECENDYIQGWNLSRN